MACAVSIALDGAASQLIRNRLPNNADANWSGRARRICCIWLAVTVPAAPASVRSESGSAPCKEWQPAIPVQPANQLKAKRPEYCSEPEGEQKLGMPHARFEPMR